MNFTIDVDTERRVVISKIYGIWKKETAEAYHKEYLEVVKPLLGDKWAKLTNLINWKSSYPEIVEVLGEHMHWCQENGAVYSLYVIDNPVTRNQLQKMIDSGHANMITKLFRTMEEGEKFLTENGY
jgi:hypothetical protein